MRPKPYSEEWWLRLDVRNALRKIVERSKKEVNSEMSEHEARLREARIVIPLLVGLLAFFGIGIICICLRLWRM